MKLSVFIAILGFAAPALAQTSLLNDTARVIAGLSVKGPLEAFTATSEWRGHADEMNKAWAKKERDQVGPIRSWMATNQPLYYRTSGTVYYLFSGPDFLYANLFFPNASTYILCGLEPVGEMPALSAIPPETLGGELAALRGSMSTILNFHYFITKEMRAELGRGRLVGTVPILCVFLARTGHTVLDIQSVNKPASGVKIDFTHGGAVQTLYYFKTDLSNGGSNAFLRWSAGRGPGMSLLKAASYLMHTEDFSNVRSFLLNHSRVLIQDDSGIPLRAFKGWEVEFFGRYVRHAEMFDKYFQPDLAAVYEESPPPELGFAFGYHWQKDRGILMVGRRRGE